MSRHQKDDNCCAAARHSKWLAFSGGSVPAARAASLGNPAVEPDATPVGSRTDSRRNEVRELANLHTITNKTMRMKNSHVRPHRYTATNTSKMSGTTTTNEIAADRSAPVALAGQAPAVRVREVQARADPAVARGHQDLQAARAAGVRHRVALDAPIVQRDQVGPIGLPARATTSELNEPAAAPA